MWFAAVGAVVTAFTLEHGAHDDLGFSLQQIQAPAVIAAVVIGALVAAEHFGKKLRKPK
jgi:hypothetical protein